MKISGKLHVPATLPREQHLRSHGIGACWKPQFLYTFWKGKTFFFPVGNRKLIILPPRL